MKNNCKKNLIIGGAGFIGSHLSKKLLDLGQEVVVIDNLSVDIKNKDSDKIKIYKEDAKDRNNILDIFKKEKPDLVYHLAGAINLRREITDTLFKKDINILERTDSVLEACRLSNVKKFIFVSSGGAIYENAVVIPTPESYPAHPNSLYGLSNLIIEKYIELYSGKKYNLNFSIIRLSNVFGPKQWKSGLVPSAIISVLRGEKPVIYGKGNQTRDFIYIDDAVDALIFLADKIRNEIYNIASGKEISLNQLLLTIGEILKVQFIANYKTGRDGDVLRSVLDISKAQKNLGYNPKINFEEGLLKTIDWYKNNEK